MKPTTTKTIKYITLCICITISVCGAAQKPFVRIYNLQNRLISKGHLLPGTDSTAELERGDSTREIIDVKIIGHINLSYTAGHSILMGAIIGTATGSLLGAIGSGNTNDPGDWYSTGDVIGGGAIAGGVLGAVTGTVIGLTKKKEPYAVNGDTGKWKKIRYRIFMN